MITVAKRAIKDYWGDWGEALTPPPTFNVPEYQEKLDTICGKSRGESIMRLEWGGNSTITQYTEWGIGGEPVKAAIRPRFAIPRTHPLLMNRMYIPIRRWIITERSEAGQRKPWDNFDNEFTDENGVVCQAADKTHHGHEYVPYVYVGDHSKCAPDCCADRLCLGDYKHPDEAELNYLARCKSKLEKEFFCDPYNPLSEAQLAKINMENKEIREKRLETQENDFDYESKQIWSGVKPIITGETTRFIYKDSKPI